MESVSVEIQVEALLMLGITTGVSTRYTEADESRLNRPQAKENPPKRVLGNSLENNISTVNRTGTIYKN